MDLHRRLRERAASYRSGGPSSEHTAELLEEAAHEIDAMQEGERVWHPINSAPKDGTPVLLKRDDRYPFVGSYRFATRGEPSCDYEQTWRARCCGRVDAPTHWAPLPAN